MNILIAIITITILIVLIEVKSYNKTSKNPPKCNHQWDSSITTEEEFYYWYTSEGVPPTKTVKKTSYQNCKKCNKIRKIS